MHRDRPNLARERHGIRRELDRDLTARVPGLIADPPEYLADRIGSRPDGAAAGLWDTAAARIDQHRTAYDIDSRDPLGRARWDDTAFDASRLAATKACEGLERTLGRVHVIEPPHLAAGLSL